MPNILRKITYAKKSGETWDTPVELTNAHFKNVIIGYGSQKDAATFDVPKAKRYFDDNGTNTPDIESSDLVQLYVARNKSLPYTFTNTDLLFEGVVDTVTQKVNGQGNIATVNMFNFIEVFFDVELPYYNTQLTFVEHAKALVDTLIATGNPIEWDPANNLLTKTGGFPKKDLALNYTPAFVIMDRLVGDDFTEDGQYFWYLSKGSAGKRKFTIAKKDNTLTGTIDETLPIQDISVDKGKDAVLNYLIYNCGIDHEGVSVESFVFDAGSIGKNGWKTDFMIDETGHIFGSLQEAEVRNNRSDFTFDSRDNLTSPFPSSYPYTMHFDGSTANNDAEYNDKLRVEALAQGERDALSRLDNIAKEQYVVNINLPYTNKFVIGGLYSFDLEKLRQFDNQLRLKNINYTMEGVTLSFDQDAKDRT